MENYSTDWKVLSDHRILENIASFIRNTRIDQNKTQAELALASGVSRRTLSAFESGKNNIQLLSLIQLLRALNSLHVFNEFRIIKMISPLLLAKEEQAQYKRARPSIRLKKPPKSDW